MYNQTIFLGSQQGYVANKYTLNVLDESILVHYIAM